MLTKIEQYSNTMTNKYNNHMENKQNEISTKILLNNLNFKIMKKIAFSFLGLLLLAFPALSQSNDEYFQTQEEEVPVDQMTLPGKDIPDSLKSSVKKSFEYATDIQWYSFPYVLKKYGWAFKNEDPNAKNEKIQFYEVKIKNSNGDRVDAIFSKGGKLIRSKEVIHDFDLPKSVVTAIENGEYKNWKITNDMAIIKDAKTESEYFRVTVAKNNKKHIMYFSKDGTELKNRA